MNWNNLKNYKCPKCSSVLTQELVKMSSDVECHKYHNCTKCDFKIGDVRCGEILRGNNKYHHTPSEEENLSELNNL